MTQTATLIQTREILQHQLQLLWQQPDLASCLPPVMLWGPPGVGKSTVIRELCKELQIGFIDVRLAQREPVDLRGLPVPDGNQVRWLLSSEWPRNPDSKGIILFDELTAADRTLQVAAYEFILDRRLGELYRVPDGWLICAAGNRSEDRAVAMTFSSALANRFCHLELAPDLEEWVRWAASRTLDPLVSAFLRFRPQAFFSMSGNLERGWPSPRSWERVAHLLQHRQQLSWDALALMVHGLVGEGAATEFLGFARWAEQLPDIPALLRGELLFEPPERADQRFALCAALAYHLWRAKDAAEQQVFLEHFFRIGLALSSDFATLAMMDAMEGQDEAEQMQRAEAIFCHPRFEAWSNLHGQVLARAQEACFTSSTSNLQKGELLPQPSELLRHV